MALLKNQVRWIIFVHALCSCDGYKCSQYVSKYLSIIYCIAMATLSIDKLDITTDPNCIQ